MKHYDVLTLRRPKKLWAINFREPIEKNRLQPTNYKLKAHKWLMRLLFHMELVYNGVRLPLEI